jgi:ribosomal protein L16 Arg81 hydroxylase
VDFKTIGISNEEFLEKYWRKRPVVIRNGAKMFLNKTFEKNDFFKIVENINAERDISTQDENNDVVFCEDLSSGDPYLQEIANSNGKSLDVWHRCWFDGSYSKPYHGIGQHFDDSDNFVIQQTGKRLWAIGDPTSISENDRMRRARHEKGSGVAENLDNRATYVVLEPGDVLYLPIFFPHWGISIEESVSITFAVQSNSPLYLLTPFFKEVLSLDKHWWNPVPAHSSDFLSPEYIGSLANKLSNPEFLTEVVHLWYEKNKEYHHMNKDSLVNDTLAFQPVDFLAIDWKPDNGLDELNNSQLQILDNEIDKEVIKNILSNANERTINDFRDNLLQLQNY